MSEEQTWNSEDTRLYSFTVFFGPWQAVVMEAGYTSEAPMCAGRLEAVTHWLRYGRFVPRFSGNGYCGIRVDGNTIWCSQNDIRRKTVLQ